MTRLPPDSWRLSLYLLLFPNVPSTVSAQSLRRDGRTIVSSRRSSTAVGSCNNQCAQEMSE